jgi:hypothetical protein
MAPFSALLVDGYGGQDAVAVCTIREIRDPTPAERRLAARARFTRIVEAGGPPLEVATQAMRALGESLRWEFGALWLMTPETQRLSCAVVWRSPWVDLTALEGVEPANHLSTGRRAGRAVLATSGAMWVTDVVAEHIPDPCRQLDEVGELVHGWSGWSGFPVWAGDDRLGSSSPSVVRSGSRMRSSWR